MNKSGSVAIYAMMVGLLIIILAFALAPSVSESTSTARNESNLNCSSSDISNFDKATCVAADLTLFYFIGALVLIGGAFVTIKIIFA